jgi:hypothetical protein
MRVEIPEMLSYRNKPVKEPMKRFELFLKICQKTEAEVRTCDFNAINGGTGKSVPGVFSIFKPGPRPATAIFVVDSIRQERAEDAYAPGAFP